MKHGTPEENIVFGSKEMFRFIRKISFISETWIHCSLKLKDFCFCFHLETEMFCV